METPEWMPFVGDAGPKPAPFPERAAEWATELAYRDIPRPVRRSGKAQLTGCVGAALWTRTHPLGENIRGSVPDRAGGATFLAGGYVDPASAAAGNAALASALGFEGSVLGGKTGVSAVFVPLAYAEAAGASGEALLVAQIAANEIAGRLGASVPTGPFSGANAAWIHAVGAAVGRGVIENDDPGTLADAIASALTQPPRQFDRARLGSDGGAGGASDPVRAGLAAVDGARSGIGVDHGLVESPGGFLSTVTRTPAPDWLYGLGDRWHSAALTVGAVPGSPDIAAAAESALEVRGRLDRGRTGISEVDVYGTHESVTRNSAAEEYLDGGAAPVAAALESVSRSVAAAIVDGECGPSGIGGRVDGTAVGRVADRVRVHHDPAKTVAALRSTVPEGVDLRGTFRAPVPRIVRAVGGRGAIRHPRTVLGAARRLSTPADPTGGIRRIGARVVARTDDGRTFEASVDRPTGVAGGPPAEIRATARRKCLEALVALGRSGSAARRQADRLLAIDDSETVRLDELVGGAG